MRIVIDLVEMAERMPTAKDGDAQGCVVTLRQSDGIRVEHWSNVVKFGGHITHWGTYRMMKDKENEA